MISPCTIIGTCRHRKGERARARVQDGRPPRLHALRRRRVGGQEGTGEGKQG